MREFGFRYVYFHPITFGVAPNDRRCYPLYSKCVELGIPVGFQVGHSAEVLPSDVGRPMLVDQVAIDFPRLRINLSHTGWPWTGEFCSMIWRHPNVYGDISAYFPSTLDPSWSSSWTAPVVATRSCTARTGSTCVVTGRTSKRLPVSDKTKQRVLHDNAVDFFGL